MNHFLPSLVGNWRRALTTNSTSGSFAAGAPTTTKPAPSTTRAVFDLARQGSRVENTIVVAPFGGNDNDDAFSVKVLGWNKTTNGLWVPSFVCEMACVLSSSLPGVAGADVVATELFCDSVVKTTGQGTVYIGTANTDIAWFTAPVAGFEIVELTFDLGTGGDGMNALVRFDK